MSGNSTGFGSKGGGNAQNGGVLANDIFMFKNSSIIFNGTANLNVPFAMQGDPNGTADNGVTINVTAGRIVTFSSQNNNYRGGTTITSGILSASLVGNIPTTGNISIAAAGGLTLSGVGTLSGARPLSNNGTLTLNTAGAISITGAFSNNPGSIFNVNAAFNTVGTWASFSIAGQLNINGAAYTSTGVFNYTAPITIANGGSFNVPTASTATISSSMTGIAGTNNFLNVNGSLTVPLGGSLSNLSAINLNNAVSTASNIFFTGNDLLNFSIPISGVTGNTNTNATFNTSTTINSTAAISNITNLNIGAATTFNSSGAFTNIGTITLSGASTLATSSPTNIIGTLNISDAASIFELLQGSKVNIGSTLVGGTFLINAGATFTITGGQNITGSGTITNEGVLNMAGNFTFNGSFLNGPTGTFVIQGQPTLTFTGASSSFVNQGSILLNFATNNTLPSININNASFFDMSHGTIVVGHNNNYIATGTYPFINVAPAQATPINPGVAIVPEASFYISSVTLSATTSQVSVSIVRDGFDQHALTPNTQQIGALLEFIAQHNPSTAQMNLINALNQITNAVQLTAALESLLPPQYTMLITEQKQDNVLALVDIRLAQVQHGYGAGDTVSEDTLAVWARPFHSNGNQATRQNLIGYTDKTHGWILGLDRSINNKFTLGVAGDTSKTTVVQADNPQTKTLINTYEVTFYGTYKTSSDFYIDGVLCGGVSNYHGIRVINFPGFSAAALANYSSQQITTKLMASKLFAIGDAWQLTPHGMAQYTFIRQLAYTESGAGPYDMFVDPDNINLFRLGAGTSLEYPFRSGNMISIPGVIAMMYVDVKGGADTVSTMFTFGGPFIVSSVHNPKMMIRLGATYELKLNENFEAIAGYDYFFRHGFKGHDAFINLRYIF